MRRRRQHRRAVQTATESLETRVLPASFYVNSLDDNTTVGDGKRTLREAIELANNNPGLDIVRFRSDLSGVIRLTEGPLDLESGETRILGNGRNDTIIDGLNSTQIIDWQSGVGTLVLRDLTFRNGRSTGDGGALGEISEDQVV